MAMRMRRWVVALTLAACGHAAPIKWTRGPVPTTKNLLSVACTAAGDVDAVDDAGDVHALRGRVARPPANADRTAAAQFKLPGTVAYGQHRIDAIARDDAHVYALGRFTAISNSLENDFAYLLRSDDNGVKWTAVWAGPDRGPMGANRNGPEVGAALAVQRSGVVLAANDGAVLTSIDLGNTFVRHATPATAPLAALWSDSTSIYGVGRHGEIVISGDGGNSFELMHEGDADLTAITGCGTDIWIVGARGTVLSRRSRS